MFFLETVFAEVKNLGLQGCSVSSIREKKGQFRKEFFKILKF